MIEDTTKATNHTMRLQKPKRPLSAYNFFFSRERQKIIATNMAKSGASKEEIVRVLAIKGKDMPHRKSHGTISFRTLAKVIADKWKSMAAGEKEPFKELARVETLRYRKEVEEWKTSQRITQLTADVGPKGLEKIPQGGATKSGRHEVLSGPDSLNFTTTRSSPPQNEIGDSSSYINKVQPSLRIHDDLGKKIPVMTLSCGGSSSIIETMTMAEPVSITDILLNQYKRNNSVQAPKSKVVFNCHRYMHRLNELAQHLDDECFELLNCLSS